MKQGIRSFKKTFLFTLHDYKFETLTRFKENIVGGNPIYFSSSTDWRSDQLYQHHSQGTLLQSNPKDMKAL